MFFFWQLVIDLQLLLLRLIRSLREGDFDLRVQVCDELGEWALAFDRQNYLRALPLYVKDMVQLHQKHQNV